MQHLGQRVDQVVIGAFDRCVIEARVAIGLRVEIEVVVAQPFELVEIFLVIDRPEQTAELAELISFRLACERAQRDYGVQHIDLADGNEMIPFVRSAGLAGIRFHIRLVPERDCTQAT
jgi:hypothetical protein